MVDVFLHLSDVHCGGSGGQVPCILNLGTAWTQRSGRFVPGKKSPVLIG